MAPARRETTISKTEYYIFFWSDRSSNRRSKMMMMAGEGDVEQENISFLTKLKHHSHARFVWSTMSIIVCDVRCDGTIQQARLLSFQYRFVSCLVFVRCLWAMRRETLMYSACAAYAPRSGHNFSFFSGKFTVRRSSKKNTWVYRSNYSVHNTSKQAAKRRSSDEDTRRWISSRTTQKMRWISLLTCSGCMKEAWYKNKLVARNARLLNSKRHNFSSFRLTQDATRRRSAFFMNLGTFSRIFSFRSIFFKWQITLIRTPERAYTKDRIRIKFGTHTRGTTHLHLHR